MEQIYILLIIAASVGLWFLNEKVIVPKLVEPYSHEPYTRFEKCKPFLGTANGIGLTLGGGWGRYDAITDSSVYYLFLTIFVPLIPIACYRASEVEPGSKHRQYRIYGHEKWRFGEIVVIYISSLAWAAGSISILCLIISFF